MKSSSQDRPQIQRLCAEKAVTHRERFAPSPTGPLHLGHAYSAITAWNNAIRADGEFLLRIEDIDQSRARPEWEALIYEDLHWLGLDWPKPVLRQSDRLGAYNEALQRGFEQPLESRIALCLHLYAP